MKYQKITKFSKSLQQNNSETVENENDKENYWYSWYQYNSIIMEYQKIINWPDNAYNQPTKFRTKSWIEINDDARGTYDANSQIKLKLQC